MLIARKSRKDRLSPIPGEQIEEDKMPIYEYLCPKCKTEFELMRPFNEADKPAICPKCNSEAQKQIANFASKTGSYLQSPAKPFGRGTPENKQEISPASNLERNVGEKALPRRKHYPRLLKEYERKLDAKWRK
ncbi:MAG: zinc ribbon domain-containing protein [Dehalococcoidales bacterium]|nr:zinc ribbon domain-containing protein [Dehalococcoidales bacterium]